MKKNLGLILLTIILFLGLICIFLNNFKFFKANEVQAVVTEDYSVKNLEINSNPVNISEVLKFNTRR